MTETALNIGLEIGDVVVRKGVSGPRGTIQNIRVETVRTQIVQGTDEGPGVTVSVFWDNGTVSHLIPNGLTKV